MKPNESVNTAPLVALCEKWERQGYNAEDTWGKGSGDGLLKRAAELRTTIATLSGLTPRQMKILAAANECRKTNGVRCLTEFAGRQRDERLKYDTNKLIAAALSDEGGEYGE